MNKDKRVDNFDMEILIRYILLPGVLFSVSLLDVDLVWHWAGLRNLRFEHSINGMNLFEFILSTLRQGSSHAICPRFILNIGIGVLMFTPFVRILASGFYFALIERKWRYTLFTGFVFCVLTYSLFLR